MEKVFDALKNKLHEKKAWGTSLRTKATQGQFVALTHNLLRIYEARLEREHGVENTAEAAAGTALGDAAHRAAGGTPAHDPAPGPAPAHAALGQVHPLVAPGLRENLAEAEAVPRLTHLYASL